MQRRWSLALLLCAPLAARGFSIETVVSTGCHERLALRAVESGTWPNDTSRPLATDEDRALSANLEFNAPPAADAWTLALLLGVRDNDLHGAALLDLPDLVEVHNGHDNQDEHCLRGPADDGPSGDAQALEACRAFILRELELALGDDAQPELSATKDVKVALRWETREVAVERFGFHLGRAMHGLQDSFTHAFRSDDQRRVLSVLNWVDPVLAGDYTPARDGWPHQSSLDACDGDEQVAPRVTAATEASRALFLAVTGATERSSRLAAAGVVLDDWLTYEPGCDASNAYCGHALATAGCASAGGAPALAVLGFLALFGPLGIAPRRRRRGARGLAPLTLLGALLLAAPAARAEPAEVEAEADAPTQRFSLHAAIGASIDRGGGSLAVGGGLAWGPHAQVRVDLELNPWLDTLSGHLVPGALSAYASFVWVWVALGRVELASSVSLGASALLFQAVGAEAGSFGLFAGASMMRVGIRLSDRLTLELTPEAVVAVPSLKGVPLAYRQYRATAGLRWELGP
jgi:hypothetical protein